MRLRYEIKNGIKYPIHPRPELRARSLSLSLSPQNKEIIGSVPVRELREFLEPCSEFDTVNITQDSLGIKFSYNDPKYLTLVKQYKKELARANAQYNLQSINKQRAFLLQQEQKIQKEYPDLGIKNN